MIAIFNMLSVTCYMWHLISLICGMLLAKNQQTNKSIALNKIEIGLPDIRKDAVAVNWNFQEF